MDRNEVIRSHREGEISKCTRQRSGGFLCNRLFVVLEPESILFEFAFESFDALGRFRMWEIFDQLVDTTARLHDAKTSSHNAAHGTRFLRPDPEQKNGRTA